MAGNLYAAFVGSEDDTVPAASALTNTPAKQNPYEQFVQSDTSTAASAPAAEALKQSVSTQGDLPQLKPWTPTLGDKFSDVLSKIRTSSPVETLLGRTPEEISAIPAGEDATTTHDAGVMGLFTNKKPIINPVENPTTTGQGFKNLAAEIVNSVASPGGIATLAVGGEAAPVIKRLMERALGCKALKTPMTPSSKLSKTHP